MSRESRLRREIPPKGTGHPLVSPVQPVLLLKTMGNGGAIPGQGFPGLDFEPSPVLRGFVQSPIRLAQALAVASRRLVAQSALADPKGGSKTNSGLPNPTV